MKIKYLLLLAICLLSFCISQETNLKQKITEETNEDKEEDPTTEENNENHEEEEELDYDERKRREEEEERLAEQEYLEEEKRKNDEINEMMAVHQRERKNDGKCFLDAFSSIVQNDRGCISPYVNQMYCTISECEIKNKIPSADQYNECINNTCRPHFDCVQDANKKIYECLSKKNQQKTNDKNEDNNNNNNKSQKAEEEQKFYDEEGDNEEEINNSDIEKTEDQKSNASIISFAFLGLFLILF
ncbi:hypothetical protein TTHERM_01499910 (macronuclear) [Tetrahymena thermophila SB210]|uniref:Transmembrane protein n=1 Tax=Tetrahymena thermophila (strain SB210) TaxID=312017 RepID=Q228T6_TETTS|nr:hypothetical protein TTHERM_01499910 [Tetrahymena thermophila SB210]EAR81799.1 hypothetical protein TTHERM_01499910 [Tetrahymena thermophila SB210]|eukprot:XP_001029462.1 hypothetical protein TTHERM_01499910 [Tetrahymena thermophila SB210]